MSRMRVANDLAIAPNHPARRGLRLYRTMSLRVHDLRRRAAWWRFGVETLIESCPPRSRRLSATRRGTYLRRPEIRKVTRTSALRPNLFRPCRSSLSGAADAFGFTDEEIAVVCASHSGEDHHLALVRSVLAKGWPPRRRPPEWPTSTVSRPVRGPARPGAARHLVRYTATAPANTPVCWRSVSTKTGTA